MKKNSQLWMSNLLIFTKDKVRINQYGGGINCRRQNLSQKYKFNSQLTNTQSPFKHETQYQNPYKKQSKVFDFNDYGLSTKQIDKNPFLSASPVRLFCKSQPKLTCIGLTSWQKERYRKINQKDEIKESLLDNKISDKNYQQSKQSVWDSQINIINSKKDQNLIKKTYSVNFEPRRQELNEDILTNTLKTNKKSQKQKKINNKQFLYQAKDLIRITELHNSAQQSIIEKNPKIKVEPKNSIINIRFSRQSDDNNIFPVWREQQIKRTPKQYKLDNRKSKQNINFMNKNLIINNPNNKPPKLYYNNLIYEAVQIF